MGMANVVTFDGGYDRKGTIVVEIAKCSCCGTENTVVITVDSSEGEYAKGRICEDCANKFFNSAY